MISVSAHELLDAVDDIGVYWERCLNNSISDYEETDLKVEDVYPSAREAVYRAGRILRGLPISRHMLAALRDAEYAFDDDHPGSWVRFEDMMVALKALRESILTEFDGVLFLHIPEARVSLYEQHEPPFGTAVEEAFPSACADIAAAARLMAVEEPTAAVFHLMRIAEHGLRSLANELGIGLSDHVDLESWKVVIDQINKAIKRFEESAPKSAEKSKRLTVYATSAVTIGHFKNAWRNHVAHARGSYEAREAMRIWDHVRAFMEELAMAGIGG